MSKDLNNKHPNKIKVAYFLKPFGLKGEIKAEILTDFPDRFAQEFVYTYGVDGELAEVKLKGKARLSLGFAYFKFKGLDICDDVDFLRKKYLYVDVTELASLPNDVSFVHDIIGCEVLDFATSLSLGTLRDVMKYPANDVYVIQTFSSGDVLFPATPEFVAEVDVTRRLIFVNRFEEFL